jgi:hypothetical protein
MLFFTTGYYFLFLFEGGVEPRPLLLRPFIGLLYQPWVTDGDDCGAISGTNVEENIWTKEG